MAPEPAHKPPRLQEAHAESNILLLDAEMMTAPYSCGVGRVDQYSCWASLHAPWLHVEAATPTLK